MTDYAGGLQFQPPQMALKKLNIDVLSTSTEAIAYEISPGDVAVIPSKRTPGGIKIEIPEFNGTAIVYLTTLPPEFPRSSATVAGSGPVAVNLLIEQVQATMASTLRSIASCMTMATNSPTPTPTRSSIR